MQIELTPREARVLGVLVEKELSTPDYYPMTINALTNACNQKTNRDPVVSYEDFEVEEAIETLQRKRLVGTASSTYGRASKYRHTLAEVLELDPPQRAVLASLMLRGPETPGELRGRASRMHPFDTLEQVESPSMSPETLDVLAEAIQNRQVQGSHLVSNAGFIRDRDALAQAASILRDHVSLFIQMDMEPEPVVEEQEVDEEVQRIRELLAQPVDELDLSDTFQMDYLAFILAFALVGALAVGVYMIRPVPGTGGPLSLALEALVLLWLVLLVAYIVYFLAKMLNLVDRTKWVEVRQDEIRIGRRRFPGGSGRFQTGQAGRPARPMTEPASDTLRLFAARIYLFYEGGRRIDTSLRSRNLDRLGEITALLNARMGAPDED